MPEPFMPRSCRAARKSIQVKISTLLAAGALLASAALLPRDASAQEGPNALRVDGDVGVISSSKQPFLVPIHIRHSGDVDAVHIGLDYDELMLRFEDAWSLEDSIGQEPWYVNHVKGQGHITLLVPIDPQDKGTEEEILIQLEFRLASPTEKSSYGYRSSTSILLDGFSTYFLRRDDQETLWPDTAQDGGVIIYFCDAIEVGSATLSPDYRFFTIPVYVTHIRAAAMPFSMGLDYDELYLDLVGVTPASKLLLPGVGRYDHKTEGGKAWIEWSFVDGYYPQLFRSHLLDLQFEYLPGAGAPVDSPVLRLIPNFDSPASAGAGGGSVEVREGSLIVVGPEFLRGDADGSGDIGLNDAFTILSFLTGFAFDGAGTPSCLDAMDVGMDGQIDITDAIHLLNYLYLEGSPPEPPFPDPGSNPPGSLSIGCDSGKPTFEAMPLAPRL